jgi:arsenate reductase
MKQRVLFLCTHNSARSQMAEALLRALGGDCFEVASAGTEASQVRPEAVAVMAEPGIDISGQHSKTLAPFLDHRWDSVITLCDEANESCPVFASAERRLHWSLPDPSRATADDTTRLAVYRLVRDAIADRLRQELLSSSGSSPSV